ncbi:MAG TPA: glycosyl hydrolase family 28-related protein [Fimbriimonas sp.]|nr:glycosyl hydrolase family 28-related protein [Fimbriimonas sp.]
MVRLGMSVLLALWAAAVGGQSSGFLNVRDFGAKGDGVNLDSVAINAAIEAAAARGGGTVLLPAGTYRSVSIRLKSNVSLYLDSGAALLAADRGPGVEYDAAEGNPNNRYQDFGHTHFHNSLIWGEHVENVSILGRGEIYGKGLVRGDSKYSTDGNKSISLRECKNVLIRDITIRHGGWFTILATGVDHMTIDNLIIDTNRDGMDIDCCKDVHVSNCSVNSPDDDGICLKSSFPLGYARATEDVSITNCHVSGFQEGSFLDGTFVRKGYPTGRIKFGTEANGGFKNIAISNCVFDYSRGFALEEVDGGDLEDVTISNITMRDIINAPIFLRLGARLRGPAGTPVGHVRRVSISNVRVVGAHEASIIAGIPGHPIEDVTLSNIRVESVGGAPAAQADVVPKEDEKGYPEPEAFGKMPAQEFYVRHAKNVEFHDVEARTAAEDGRPPFVLADVDGADFFQVKASRPPSGPFMRLEQVKNLRTRLVEGVRDAEKQNVVRGSR